MTPVTLWFLLGAALFIAEFAAPGLIVGFFAAGAWITALLVSFGILDDVTAQVLVFGVSSLVTLFALRRFVKNWFVGKSASGADTLEDEFVGKEVTVLQDIPGGPGHGRVELKGAEWSASSESFLPEGDIARVVKLEGLNLIVEPI